MKATLEFQLPEEQEEFRMAVDASEWFGLVFDLTEDLRRRLKYENPSEAEAKVLAELRLQIYEMAGERGLQL